MKKALIGCGGHAREVMSQMGTYLPCFVDEDYVVDGVYPLSMFNPNEYEVMVAVADPKKRFEIVGKLPQKTKYFSWVHPTSLILNEDVTIGIGSFIGAFCILTTNIKIGNHAILNRTNQVGHDCQIGDFFSAMPGAIVSGNVQIGNCVYLGNNSSIREKIEICSSTIIGMNSAVVHNIQEPGTYVGIPSKKIKK
jgi:sugar O-acyltransferase (sialic acid O-acetyltransferase NeuD family)